MISVGKSPLCSYFGAIRIAPATGQTQHYQYAAPSAAAFPSRSGAPVSTTPGAVVLTHIVAMATDHEGHLWYVRAGSDHLEEVIA